MSAPEAADRDRALWAAVVESEGRFTGARAAFMTGAADRLAAVRAALRTASQRGTALRVLRLFTVAERQALFDELVRLVSVGHADVDLCREAILSLPRDWVLATIESHAEPLLRNGTEEEYRRLLELYLQLDRELTARLAARAARHHDPDVREAGEDFLDRLGAR